MPIDRTLFNLWVDEPAGGDGSTGTKLTKARLDSDILDPIDDALAAGGVAGATTQVMFNDAGVLAGDAGLTYNKTTDALTVVGDVVVGGMLRAGTSDASDNDSIELNGGGATGATRGGSVTVYGNEHGSLPGYARVQLGGGVASKFQVVDETPSTIFEIDRAGGNVYINDNSNGNMTRGLTINQGAADDEAVALKSSDIAHGITDQVETDTYGAVSKYHSANGGLRLRGLSEAEVGVKIDGIETVGSTTKSTAATGALVFNGYLKSGTTVQGMATNSNIAVFQTIDVTRFILDADGDSHQDVGTAWTNFDIEDDVSVLNLLAAYVTRPDDPLRETFGRWLLQSRATLERLRLVTFNEDGHHFVNMSRLTMLLVGAVRQMGSRMERLEQRLLALEA